MNIILEKLESLALLSLELNHQQEFQNHYVQVGF